LLTLLESHLALCEFTLTTAERLHPIVDEIVHGAERSSRRLLNVALEIAASLGEGSERPCLAPVPMFAPAAALEQAGWSRADWFTQAVMCARLTAAAYPALGLDRDASGWVIAAALVQDIGSWHQPHRYRHQKALQEGRKRAEPNHPATGAAILNGLVDASVLLSLLVGTHHERIDGTGFPQRLSGPRLTREQQCLGLMARMTELLTDPITGQLAVEHAEPLETAAGLRLWREVRRGSFAEPFARIVLDSLRPGLADDVNALYPMRVRRLVDMAHPVPAPLGQTTKPGMETSAVNAPAFLRHQRSRGGSLTRAIRHGRDW
ncbi:MAG: HD domain-containing phosphohydrolase, partial [Planctomycetaceae bacterium]|nr:HD domain-containing phosphohydrolase [Planctomycetaceae bacterium]